MYMKKPLSVGFFGVLGLFCLAQCSLGSLMLLQISEFLLRVSIQSFKLLRQALPSSLKLLLTRHFAIEKGKVTNTDVKRLMSSSIVRGHFLKPRAASFHPRPRV